MIDFSKNLGGWLPIDTAPKDRSILLFVPQIEYESNTVSRKREVSDERVGEGL